MKTLHFIFLLCAGATLNGFSQVEISSNNKVGIGIAPDNNYSIMMKGDVFLKGAHNNNMKLLATAGSGGPFVEISPDMEPIYTNNSYIGKDNNPWGIGYFNFMYVNNFLRVNGSYITGSDKRFKKDIQQLHFDKNLFSQLNPVTYHMVDSLEVTKKNGEKSMLRFDKTNYPINGFLAQEVQQNYPELVEIDNETGVLGIKPLEFIPILVKALQAQQKEIDDLKELITNQTKPASTPSKTTSSDTNTPRDETSQITLYQNNPNPFSQSTEIKYYLPNTVSTALLCIYDLQGKQLKQLIISERGKGSQTINDFEFSAGIYLYGLIADGQQTDVKRMILTE
ncbi:MAG: tail fiber domain-containing protein [Bacteroidales bacterium]|nr:tail fiber domain-containing protein [Bacteroidales bacterium]